MNEKIQRAHLYAGCEGPLYLKTRERSVCLISNNQGVVVGVKTLHPSKREIEGSWWVCSSIGREGGVVTFVCIGNLSMRGGPGMHMISRVPRYKIKHT